jgi:hypothetical protein
VGSLVFVVVAGTALDSALTRTSPGADASAVFDRSKPGKVPLPEGGNIAVASFTVKAKKRRKKKARRASEAAKRRRAPKPPKFRVLNRKRLPKSLRAVVGVGRNKGRKSRFTAYVVLVNRGAGATARASGGVITQTLSLDLEPRNRRDFVYVVPGRQQTGWNVAPLDDIGSPYWDAVAEAIAGGRQRPRWSGLFGQGFGIGTQATGELGIFAAGNRPDVRFPIFDQQADLTASYTSTLSLPEPTTPPLPNCQFGAALFAGHPAETIVGARCTGALSRLFIDGPGDATVVNQLPPQGATFEVTPDGRVISFFRANGSPFAANADVFGNVRWSQSTPPGTILSMRALFPDGRSFGPRAVTVQGQPPPPPECDNDGDDDGDGTIDWEHDPSCGDADDDSEDSVFDCTLVGSDPPGDATNFGVSGSCSGPVRGIHFSGLDHSWSYYEVQHSEGTCTVNPGGTLLQCDSIKEAMGNPEHLVEALFKTEPHAPNQQIKLEFFDQNGVKVGEKIVTRP